MVVTIRVVCKVDIGFILRPQEPRRHFQKVLFLTLQFPLRSFFTCPHSPRGAFPSNLPRSLPTARSFPPAHFHFLIRGSHQPPGSPSHRPEQPDSNCLSDRVSDRYIFSCPGAWLSRDPPPGSLSCRFVRLPGHSAPPEPFLEPFLGVSERAEFPGCLV